jgi:SAM-dependent methyltransferase
MDKRAHEVNRRSWNEATRAHNSHKGEQARLLREGGSTLFPEELELLGELHGRRLLHLQCNSGQDTLSLAARGAIVTGVDISDEAIAFARRLSEESGLGGTFARSDVYDWLATVEPRFDVVFSSYGAYGWLSDLKTWAAGIARALAPGGRFVLVDFHPTAMIFDERWQHRWPYSTGGRAIESPSGVTDYVSLSGAGLCPDGYQPGLVDFQNPHPSCEFAWGLGEIVGAVLEAGLRLEALVEWPYSNGAQLFDGMRLGEGRRYYAPAETPEIPLMFGLRASL